MWLLVVFICVLIAGSQLARYHRNLKGRVADIPQQHEPAGGEHRSSTAVLVQPDEGNAQTADTSIVGTTHPFTKHTASLLPAAAPDNRVMDAVAVELASDSLLFSHPTAAAGPAFGSSLRWNPLTFQRSADRFAQRIATLLLKQATESSKLLDEEITSLQRYRLGGIGLLLGKSDTVHSKQIPLRSTACRHVLDAGLSAVETPQSPVDTSFVAYTYRRKTERVHHCFSKLSMFLIATFSDEASLFEQLEMVMGLLYVGAVSSRTVVIPSLRLPSGQRVPFSHVFDVRMLYTSAVTDSAQQPVVCVLEEDEFVSLETARLNLLQQQTDETSDKNSRADLFMRLRDTSCIKATWRMAEQIQNFRESAPIHCDEVNTVSFPTTLSAHDVDSATDSLHDSYSELETERAVDEAVLELAGSFHRIVHVGPLISSALSLLVPSALEGYRTFTARHMNHLSLHAAEPSLPPVVELHRCLWRLLLPHPFARRGAKLFDLVMEEIVPSPSGRALTLSERNVPQEGPLLQPRTQQQHENTTAGMPLLKSWRHGGVAIHHHPVFPGGISCVALQKYFAAGRPRLCQLDEADLTVIVDGLQRGGAAAIHFGPLAVAESFLLVRQIEAAVLLRAQQSIATVPVDSDGAPLPPETLTMRHVLTSPTLFRRSNRLSRFVQVVEDRRKLYVAKGNLLLQGGFSDSPSAECPFQMSNPFAAEPGLLEVLIEYWSMIFDDYFVSTSPWSAMTRTVRMRRSVNTRES